MGLRGRRGCIAAQYLAAKAVLGAACREAGMFEKCAAAYEECLKLNPEDPDNYRRVVVSCYLELGVAEKVQFIIVHALYC